MTKPLFPVVILAGGLATRIRPLTDTIPKALVPINNKPFIAHQLDLLRKQKVKRVVLCLGFLGEQIKNFVRDGSQFGLQVSYSFDGETLLGTAGAIQKALSQVDEKFFILNGDSYLTCDFFSVQNSFEKSRKAALMTVFKNDNQWDKSNIIFKNDSIITYDKMNRSPAMQHIDYGLSVMHRDCFNDIPDKVPYDLSLLNQHLLQQEQLAAFEIKERFYEIGSFTGIQELEKYLKIT